MTLSDNKQSIFCDILEEEDMYLRLSAKMLDYRLTKLELCKMKKCTAIAITMAANNCMPSIAITILTLLEYGIIICLAGHLMI